MEHERAPDQRPDQAAHLTASEIFCVVGTLCGVGVLGTRVEASSGGALAADATRLAPAGPAFSIWASVGVVATLALMLGVLLQRLTTLSEHALADRVIIDGTFGLYLGWVSVATWPTSRPLWSPPEWTPGHSSAILLRSGGWSGSRWRGQQTNRSRP